MFSPGRVASLTPKRAAVAGISCISPCAPALETASVLPLDSTAITASTSAGDTSVPIVARRMSAPARARDVLKPLKPRGANPALPARRVGNAVERQLQPPRPALIQRRRDPVPEPGILPRARLAGRRDLLTVLRPALARLCLARQLGILPGHVLGG